MAEKKVSKKEVSYAMAVAQELYNVGRGMDSNYFYNPSNANTNLINLNNNPIAPSYDTLKEAIKGYKARGAELSAYSEFMSMWDAIYKQALTYKLNLLSFDLNWYPVNANDADFASVEYKEDVKRIERFLNSFSHKKEFRDVTMNMLVRGAYFTWLRDSSGTINNETLELDVSKVQNFGLQMMPQNKCKITGEFIGKNMKGKGIAWDLDVGYFLGSGVNVEDYDPSIYKLLEDNKMADRLKSFINKPSELNKTNGSLTKNYTRVSPNNGAWCFKYDTSNFNIVPPLASVLKAVFPNDIIEKLQVDKDMLSACAIITGELKTRKDAGTDGKTPFLIDPNDVGIFMKMFQNAVGKQIKQLALPLEESKLFQFTDTNSAMFRNQLKSSAGQAVSASSLIFTDEKLSQEEMQTATSNDFQEISQSVYPQFEEFLNFFLNKKTKKYKFRFSLSGSTLAHLRRNDFDNYSKLSDKGLQVPIRKWGTLLGLECQEFEAMVAEAKHGDMQEQLFTLLNTNIGVTGLPEENNGRPKLESGELSEGGATSRDYD